MAYAYPRFSYRKAADQSTAHPAHHPLVVIGAGPVGLAVAIDLAQRGHAVVVLDDDNTVSEGSRALCWAQRSLEILDKLGVSSPMMARGIPWTVNKVFFQKEQIFSSNSQTGIEQKFPNFINLQQYYAEQFLVERAEKLAQIDLRWRHRLVNLRPGPNSVRLEIETPDGLYILDAGWVISCDGARSMVRRLMGLDFLGKVFEDRFLIADVIMQADYPNERWFWFDPPFHPRQSALLHRQADNVWRIDLQLGWQADPVTERQPERVIPRLRQMLGPDRPFELEWTSVYTFQCRRLERFRHGRILFAGDAAHQVSPFGARGANSGLQDAENLAWKLDLVLRDQAPSWLLDSYDEERVFAADDNILHSTRAAEFITPKGEISLAFRNAVLDLSRQHDFARTLVNSGRPSTPTHYRGSSLSSPDQGHFDGGPAAGAAMPDGLLENRGKTEWLCEALAGHFTLLLFQTGEDGPPLPVATIRQEPDSAVGQACDARAGTAYLIRPDGHVAGRCRNFTLSWLTQTLNRACARQP